jgi:hypothetical protein
MQVARNYEQSNAIRQTDCKRCVNLTGQARMLKFCEVEKLRYLFLDFTRWALQDFVVARSIGGAGARLLFP